MTRIAFGGARFLFGFKPFSRLCYPAARLTGSNPGERLMPDSRIFISHASKDDSFMLKIHRPDFTDVFFILKADSVWPRFQNRRFAFRMPGATGESVPR
jgi:hypothetical protein